MNILLFVIDSVRKRSLDLPPEERPKTPFLDEFARNAVDFRRAYATECWTLPTHMSMFTGLLPSEHRAHFGTMAYDGTAPTIAELLSSWGFHTEIFTRNTIFDGQLPGVTRGFRQNTLTQVPLPTWSPAAWFLTLGKPRIRRHVQTLAFFSPAQKASREFAASYARSLFPADRLLCERVLERLEELRRSRTPFFLFGNLYDCHAPYPPVENDITRPVRSLDDLVENLATFHALPRISSHAYLRDGFRLPERDRRALLRRYHHSIELMDKRLARFLEEAEGRGLLDDTVFVLTSDHGEAFGEHGLYLHDASVFDVHLSVPLWVRWPGRPAETVDDVVSTKDLFGLFLGAARGSSAGTILDPDYRRRSPVAIAEHFHYPRLPGIAPRYRQNVAALVGGNVKAIVRREGLSLFERGTDALELEPEKGSFEELELRLRKDGIALAPSVRAHLDGWNPGG